MMIYTFAKESNEIEEIFSEERHHIHENALVHLLPEPTLSVGVLTGFVAAIEPTARLRIGNDDNVWIGGRQAPSPQTSLYRLDDLLAKINADTISPYEAHVEYEMIHPFMDGNGRSGRALWLWMMRRLKAPVYGSSFLRTFYYQTLKRYSENQQR